MNFITQKEYEDMASKFWESYHLIKFVYPPEESNKRSLKKKRERTCRYCGLSTPQVRFKKEAHLIPESLGNKTLFSDFECDSCNELFGTYEDQLAKLIEIERPLNKVIGKNKYPGFTSANEQLKIRVTDFQNSKSIQIERADTENDIVSFDRENLTWKIKIKRNPLIPNKIYKYFIKLGISLLSEKEVTSNYKYALDYILGKPNVQLKSCRATGYILPHGINFEPHAYLFAKKDPHLKFATHIIAFYFLNYIYSVPILFNKNDFWFNNEVITAINYPPFFIEGDDAVNSIIKPFFVDLSSEKSERPEDQELFFQIEREQWEKRAGFDLVKNEFIDGDSINPNEIVKFLILGDNGNELSFPITK